MAVRTDAASDYLLRSANLPSSTAFTVCGWAVMDVDKNTDTTLATLENALTNATSGYYLTTGATGTELIVYSTARPGGSATLISMAVGTPFFWAMSANGAGAGLLKVSARTASENSLTSVTNTSGSFTSAALYIGNEGYGLVKPFDGRHWNVKCWDRELTDAELLVESFFDRVMYPSSLNFHWPLHDVNDTADRSGNGRDATVGGTLTTGDSLVKLWKPSVKVSGVAVAGGGTTYTITPTGSIVFSGSSTYLRTKIQNATGSIVFSASAPIAKTRIQETSGSITFSGSSVINRTKVQDSSGTITFSGAADITRTRALSSSGTLTFSSSAEIIRTKVFDASGSIVFSGTAPITFETAGGTTYTITPTGSVVFSGSATYIREKLQSNSGSVTFSANTDYTRTKIFSSSGEIAFSGTAGRSFIKVIAPTGLIAFSGTAPITYTGSGVPDVSTWRTLTGAGL